MTTWTGIHTGLPHYLDHLGVLCILLDLPLLVTEAATYAAARKFYPELKCQHVELSELSLSYLSENFDVIFESGHRWGAELLPLFELLFHKKMRIVYCPHGNSDKGHSELNPTPKDLSLYYGPHMKNLLAKTPLNGTVRTGNYRWTYYRQRQPFYDNLLHLQLDPQRKTIFYAPSWPDGENPSSFLSCCERVIEEIGEFFNVLIRWHPFLDDLYPVQTEQLKHRYEGKSGINFLNDFPCIYPILQASDAYLGDFSSIGYDFLTFDRPLYFFDTYPGTLDRCGSRLLLDSHLGKQLLQQEDREEKKKLRREAYKDVFGEEREGSEILQEIQEALSFERAPWTKL